MSTIDLGMDFQMPKNQSSQIKVMGIGGGGSNAVNYMFENGISGVDFVVCNTDAQALEASPVPIKIQLGANLTEGLGAGSNPDVGKQAAEESADKITELLDANTRMLFLTAGMGGGTGTGAAPVIADIAREKGILTVGVVTNPFSTEGGSRHKYAEEGILQLKKFVDTLLIINNDKLIEVYGDLTLTQAFAKANEILNTATKGIAEVISQHLLVNIDLNDARKVLENSGTAVMGQAQAEGENRALEAVIGALDSPLLNDNDITGAQQVLLKIVTGKGEGEIRMSELSKIKNKIQEAAGRDVNIIEGIGIDPELGDSVSVTVIATGFEQKKKPKSPTTICLEDNIDEVKNEISDLENNQQKLDLDNMNTEETITESRRPINVVDDSVVEVTDKVIFDLEEEIKDFSDEKDYGQSVDKEEEIKGFVDEKDYGQSVDKEEEIKDFSDEEDPEKFINSITEQDLEIDSVVGVNNLNTLESIEPTNESIKIEARERENRLRAISQKLRTPSGLTDLENIPAYQRNNIELDEENHSSEEHKSIFTLDEAEDKVILNENNSFLHDNVD